MITERFFYGNHALIEWVVMALFVCVTGYKFITFAKVKYNEFIRILKRNGWYEVRQTGSHITICHPDGKEPIIVPNHGSKEIGKGLQLKIMKQAGLKK